MEGWCYHIKAIVFIKPISHNNCMRFKRQVLKCPGENESSDNQYLS